MVVFVSSKLTLPSMEFRAPQHVIARVDGEELAPSLGAFRRLVVEELEEGLQEPLSRLRHEGVRVRD